MRCPPPRRSTESAPHLPARARGLRTSTHQAGQAREHGVRFLEPDVRSLGAVAGMPAQRHSSAAYAESPSSGEATLAECGESVTVERHGQRNRLEDTVTRPVSAYSAFPMRIAVAAFLLAVLLFPAAAPSQTTVVPFGASGYRYTVVEHGGLPTFQSPAYDASSFLLGAAPFGSPGFCPLASTVQTLWPTDSDLLVRRAVTLPAGASEVSVAFANDNDVLVYWNGNLIASQTHGGCATHDSPVVSVPDALVQAGSNLLAVRGADRGSQSFLDIRVSAVLNAPPDCSSAVASPIRLWPPNHKLRSVTLTVTDPDGDPVTVTITSVRQDEAVQGRGDGRTRPDAMLGSESDQVRLRAERSGNGDGRVYEVAFRASDDNGGSCTGRALVGVPHDRGRGRVPINSGLNFDSLGA